MPLRKQKGKNKYKEIKTLTECCNKEEAFYLGVETGMEVAEIMYEKKRGMQIIIEAK